MPTCTRRTTAQEILADFDGEPLHYFVSGFGTGGTLLGVARGLKAADPAIRDRRRRTGQRAGARQRHPPAARRRRHADREPPEFPAAPDAGLEPGFRLAAHRRRAMAEGLIDEIVPVDGNEALRLARELAHAGGHLRRHVERRHAGRGTRRSRGARRPGSEHRLHAARHRRALPVDAAVRRHRRGHERRGTRAVALDAELPIRRASSRAAPAAAIAAAEPAVELDEEAERVRDRVVREPRGRHVRARVVRILLVGAQAVRETRYRLPERRPRFRRAISSGDLGGRIRAVLRERTGSPTIPQIFIGGNHVGGCTDLFDAMADGSMQTLLDAAGVDVRPQRRSSIPMTCCRSGCIHGRPRDPARARGANHDRERTRHRHPRTREPEPRSPRSTAPAATGVSSR